MQLLYNQFAWLYDLVSWSVSKGYWRRWTTAVLPRLHGHRVLELGFGPGHLLETLRIEGYCVWGIDLSWPMVRMAARNPRPLGEPVRICQGTALALPFATESFDCVVSTFPADYVAEARTAAEVQRVLAPHGRFIVVDAGRLLGADVYSRFVGWLFRLFGLTTSLSGSSPHRARAAQHTELDLRYEEDRIGESQIGIWIWTK